MVTPPSVSLPTGGGAIRGIGEKFSSNPVTGTGTTSLSLGASPGRAGFGPGLTLSYDSGSGNGAFGLGWGLSLPAITRKTEKGLPRYRDAEEWDVFLLSGAEDLVPTVDAAGQPIAPPPVGGYTIARYRPRIESGFSRIERWTRQSDGDVHWRTISPDNVLSVYGKDAESRLSDPAEPSHIFSWLLCETRDDLGNAIVYRYESEDAGDVDVTQPHERCRGEADSPSRTANRYLKRVLYGNRKPLLDTKGRRPTELTPEQIQATEWLFEAVLDYGEHHLAHPEPDDAGVWPCRSDPFSSHRAGFELRTYRLCRRLLMFHHFPDRPEVGRNCLVASTDLSYRETPAATFLVAATRRGYVRGGGGDYRVQAMPPVEFSYSEATIETKVRELDAESLENMPGGLAPRDHHWVDLNGEGLAGVLAENGGGWWYKPNLGEGSFGALERVASLPSIAALGEMRQQLLDLDGDGRLDLVQLDREPAGFFARDADQDWDDFVPFAAKPNLDWGSRSLQPIDLSGDGLADLLLDGDELVTWYQSLGTEGFGPAERAIQALDEESGPRQLLSDATQTVFLADMCGDGLTDLVRIRHSEVSYWPNLGYGRFGAKVTMDGAPLLDSPDRFDPRRVRLADVDGSGPIDLLYVGAGEVRVYFNQAGYRWSAPERLPDLPHLDDRASVQVADLLGNGTACLVWSSPLATDEPSPVRYVDLMGGQKPNLLTDTVNNLGAETRIGYTSSTAFFLADRRAGRPWITRLPFPVAVVERIEHRDRVAGSRFVSRFSYHHGHYDGAEREFRGFAMTEQHDTEAFEDYAAGVIADSGTQDTTPELFQPPVTIRTWSHTGALPDGRPSLHQLSDEYYGKSAHLTEPALPAGLDEEELRECARALKGLPLRQEVFSFDGSDDERHPYRVTEHSYEIGRLQERGDRRHGVFAVHGRETVALEYDREPTDPRVTHDLALELGPHGEPVLAASVVYGRRIADPALPAAVTAAQRRTYVTFTENRYTPDINRQQPVPAYRLRAAHETRSAELTGVAPAASLFTVKELRHAIATATPIEYEAQADAGIQRRPLAHSRRRFRDDTLAPLPQGQWDTLGLAYEDYRLALTPGTVTAHYSGRVAAADLLAAGYLDLDGDGNWWAPSGRHVFPADPATHFYLPIGARDALGTETIAVLDAHHLLPERTRVTGAPWSEVSVVNDYRVLGPVEMTDQNGNRTAVELDALGMVVATATMGKPGTGEGDTLADPTVRIEYDLGAWMAARKPASAHLLARERHGPANPRWQERYVYSNGGGGIAMVKRSAPPGAALTVGGGAVSEVHAKPRWIGDGRRALNNKGNVVKAYQPFFSPSHEYEDEQALRSLGSTPILHYDPVGRNFRTDLPDGTLTRSVFGPWSTSVYDANDTVLDSRWYADQGSPNPALEPEPLANPERRAAWLTAKHAGTCATIHLDSLGRTVYAVSDRGGGATSAVRTEVDLNGRRSRLLDQEEREASRGFAAIGGAPIHSRSAERGERRMFQDVLGGPVLSWDQHGRAFRISYDDLHRPLAVHVREPGEEERLCTYALYGDRHPDAKARNLRGVAHQIYDGAGMASIESLDFAGNPTAVTRTLARDYTRAPDWGDLEAAADFAAVQAAAAPLLEAESFAAAATYDALKRPLKTTLHGGTALHATYDEAGSLASLQMQVEGNGPLLDVLSEQVRDARGRRQLARFGNGLETRYAYDPDSLRLTDLLTLRRGAPQSESVQDLHYTYDASGNITQVRDAAQQTHFFANAVVAAESLYEYDPLYQLVRASGREHAVPANDAIRDGADLAAVPQLPHLNDATAVRTYTERFEYDLLGNLRRHRHVAPVSGGGWTREYRYQADTVPGDATNRLASTSRPGDPATGPYTATYDYDEYGNMTRLGGLDPEALSWNALDQLSRVSLGGGGSAHYSYGIGGGRTRKVVDRQGALRSERIYLGPLEIYRRRRNDAPPHLERRTIHIADETGRIAQLDLKTRDDGGSDPANPLGAPLLRYVYGNHLGSAVLETDAAGTPISYEEYHPFGTTAYRSSAAGSDVSLKRHRFAGQERDEETGLYCMGARYYAPWLGRWTSPDPAGFVAGLNLFRYCGNSPQQLVDPQGTKEKVPISLDELGVAKITDPAEMARAVRAKGIDFTGFDQSGNEVKPDAVGPSSGVPHHVDARTWDFGTWLTVPGPGAGGDGGGEGGGPQPSATGGTTGTDSAGFQVSLDVDPLPTGGTGGTGTGDSTYTLAPVPDAARGAFEEAVRPYSVTGTRPTGTLHLWSDWGKAEAKAAIAREGSGWMMGDIGGQPTPEHAAAEAEFKLARASTPGGALPKAEMDRIWGRPSANVVGRAALAGHPVETHGPFRADSVQQEFEIPARVRWSGFRGGLIFAGGMFTALYGSRDPSPGVATSNVFFGVGEATSGIVYGAGAYGGSAEAMSIGTAGASAFGGAAATVNFTAASARSFSRGDVEGGLVNAVGAVGGLFLIVAAFTPAGWVALTGVALVSFASGYSVGKWLEHR